MKQLLSILITSFALTTTYCQTGNIRIKFYNNAYYDVFLTNENGEINLTNFNPWEKIENLAISNDKKYFFFRHKSSKDKSYKLCVYEISSQKKIAEIIPGFGGSFEWNENKQIIHTWGCGSNCSNLFIYNLQLKKIFYSLSTGGFTMSPKKDIVVQTNMYGNKFWLFDLRTIDNDLKGYSDTIRFTPTMDEKYSILWSLKFIDDYVFQIAPPANSSSSQVLTYDINKIDLISLKPEDTKEFYVE